MPVITNTILDGTGDPLSGCFVTARLKPTGAFVTSSFEEIVPVVSTVTTSAGVWTLDLYQNSLLTPSGSYWEIEERIPKGNGQTRLWAIEVGASPQTLYAALIDPLIPGTTSNYLTQEAGDARYVQSPGSFGTVILGPASASSAGTEATYARTDHRHPANVSGTAAERAALAGLDLYEGLRFRETDSTDKLYDYRGAAWLQKADVVICTAATRPANPYVGMKIYETDTGNELVYYGATTLWQQPWNQPWGLVGIGNITATVGSIVGTLTDIGGCSVTATALANRRWRLQAHVYAFSSVGGDFLQASITTSGNSTVAIGTLRSDTNAYAMTCDPCIVLTPSAGSLTYKLRAVRIAGTGNFSVYGDANQITQLVIEDVGPAASAPVA
jgi:hypothetical protein